MSHTKHLAIAATLSLAAVVGLVSPTAAKEKVALEVVTLKRTIEHEMKGGKPDYKSKGFNETFEVKGALLHSYTVHQVSRRNVKNFHRSSDNNKLIIKGKVFRKKYFGSGGKYKAHVVAIFLRPVKTIDPEDIDVSDLNLLSTQAYSGNAKQITAAKKQIVKQLHNLPKR